MCTHMYICSLKLYTLGALHPGVCGVGSRISFETPIETCEFCAYYQSIDRNLVGSFFARVQ